AGLAAALVAAVVLAPRRSTPPESRPVEIAEVRPPAAAVAESQPEAAEPAPAPRPLRAPEPRPREPQPEAPQDLAAAPQHAPPVPPAAVADSVATAPERRELSLRTGAGPGHARTLALARDEAGPLRYTIAGIPRAG